MRSSPGLSSTSRISTGRLPLFASSIRGFPLLWHGEMKRGAGAGLGLHPDAAAVALDHLLDDRQADPGSRVLALVVPALQHHEDALAVLRLNADAFTSHHQFPFRA